MTTNNRSFDIIHKLDNVLSTLGDKYAMTQVRCDPGDCAVKITKQGSENTLDIVVFRDPDDIEFLLFGGDGSSVADLYIYGRTIDDISGKCVNIIREFF